MKKLLLAGILITIGIATIEWSWNQKIQRQQNEEIQRPCDYECREYHRFWRRTIDEIVKRESGW